MTRPHGAALPRSALELSPGSRFLAVRLGLRMAKGLARAHGDAIVAHRGDGYPSVEAVWRRAEVPVAALERLAEADGYRSLGLGRRDALWAIRGLSDTRLPLFDGIGPTPSAAATRHPAPPTGHPTARTERPTAPHGHPAAATERPTAPYGHAPPTVMPGLDPGTPTRPVGADTTGHDGASGVEPSVALPPMTAGREVVEDYRSTGLTLRRHPVAFLRADLDRRRIVRCADLARTRDGRRLEVAGIVLVRQRPGSARGVLFITIEDETGHANLILWPSVFERQRRLVLSAGMLACQGKLQKEGEVIHVVADRLTDLSALLRSVGERDAAFPIPAGRGDQVRHPGGPDPREGAGPGGHHPRDIYIRDLRLGHGIKVPTRDFR